MGIEVCKNLEIYKDDINGNIGVGYGVIVGKFLGVNYFMKGGFGIYVVKVGDL